jgi:hypothetical protein
MATRTVLLLSMAAAAMGFQPMSGQSLALKSATTSISRAGAYASVMPYPGLEQQPTSLPGSPSRMNARTTAAGQLPVRTATTQGPRRKSRSCTVPDVFAPPPRRRLPEEAHKDCCDDGHSRGGGCIQGTRGCRDRREEGQGA